MHSCSFQGVIPNPRALMHKESVAFSCASVVSIASGERRMQSVGPAKVVPWPGWYLSTPKQYAAQNEWRWGIE
jgi:hypothetical protein